MKTKKLLTTAFALFMTIGVVSCSSNKEKMEKEEQQRQEEIRDLEARQTKLEEKAHAAEMQAQELRSQQHSSAVSSYSSDKPWASQQFALSDVEKVQEKLNNEGFNAGPVDGLIGPKTMDGIRSFQESKNITASGELNKETVDALGVDIEMPQRLSE